MDFRNLILREDANGMVRLSDVADVNLGSEVEEIGFRLNGINSVACGVAPQPGANYINISDEFYKRVEQIKQQKGNEDIIFTIVLDSTENVRKALSEVEETLIIALILVVLVVYFFLETGPLLFAHSSIFRYHWWVHFLSCISRVSVSMYSHYSPSCSQPDSSLTMVSW
jgi:multidrug efflux pump subunit AcrB